MVRRGIRCARSHLVTSAVLSGEQRPARFGFIVSKQVGSAVTRNTVRRRLKSLCAAAVADVPAGADIVVRAFPSAAGASFAELGEDIAHSLRRVLNGQRSR